MHDKKNEPWQSHWKRIFIDLIILIVAFILFSILLSYLRPDFVEASEIEPTWIYSESTKVMLCVSDQWGELEHYKAIFLVMDSVGEFVYITVETYEDTYVCVEFPDDFPTLGGWEGEYTWQCIVNGELVAEGKFRLSGKQGQSAEIMEQGGEK